MPQMCQRPADEDGIDVQPGQQLRVRERFLSLSPGQTVDVVDVSAETTADGAYPEQVTLQLSGRGTPSTAPSAMAYHGEDVRQAVERGALDRQ